MRVDVTIRVGVSDNGSGNTHGTTAEDVRDEWSVGISFSVQDTGIGIPFTMKEHIFERFTQADSSTTREYRGTGLGLAICKRLVEMMDGRIRVDSMPGEGSTFSFTVNLHLDQAQDEHVTPSPVSVADEHVPADSETSIPAPPLRILLVDDTEENRFVIEAYLKVSPYLIDNAEDGQIAVEKFTTGTYDLILMDMQMPVMDGYEATRTIRTWETDRGIDPIPIIALTAHALPEDRQKCLDAGCSDYLTKPVDKAVLLNHVQEHSQRKRLVKEDVHRSG